MARRTITALFDEYDNAVAAVRGLENEGIASADISLVGSGADRPGGKAAFLTPDQVSHSSSSGEPEPAMNAANVATGAKIGTMLGGTAGLLAGLGLLAIPGLGPVVAAGWLTAALTGAGVGLAAGGLAGSLSGSGLDTRDAEAFAEGVRRGGTLVSVRAAEERAARIVQILEQRGAVDLDERGRSWAAEGWRPARADAPETTGSAGRRARSSPARDS